MGRQTSTPLFQAGGDARGRKWRPTVFVLLLLMSSMNAADSEALYPIATFAGRESQQWGSIDDGVMGGLSNSRLERTVEGTGLFEGRVSLANNGGFASVRAALGPTDLSDFHGVRIRFRGDGKRYRLRFHSSAGFDGVAYQASFDTAPDEWQEVSIPFSDFRPTFRGRLLTDVEPLDTSSVQQVGLMIADRQEGPFRLEIDWIKAYGTAASSAATNAGER
ncbi:MAG: CIA30 family protein [Gammaproteobacteria bacterium]|jgi:monofunctional biosynthetic peptidoglycan transglycosylase